MKGGSMAWVLFVTMLPGVVLGHLWVLPMAMIGACHQIRYEGRAVLVAQWRNWAARRWGYSTTVGRAIILQPGARGRTWAHEWVHIRQGEDYGLLGLVLALPLLAVSWQAAVSVWAASPLYFLPSFLTAVLRGGNAYRDAEHERSAYAQTDGHPRSWLKRSMLLLVLLVMLPACTGPTSCPLIEGDVHWTVEEPESFPSECPVGGEWTGGLDDLSWCTGSWEADGCTYTLDRQCFDGVTAHAEMHYTSCGLWTGELVMYAPACYGIVYPMAWVTEEGCE